MTVHGRRPQLSIWSYAYHSMLHKITFKMNPHSLLQLERSLSYRLQHSQHSGSRHNIEKTEFERAVGTSKTKTGNLRPFHGRSHQWRSRFRFFENQILSSISQFFPFQSVKKLILKSIFCPNSEKMN